MPARMPNRAEVKLLRWPAESARRARYKSLGVLRLLVVEGGAPAPITTDLREDWVRAPITDADLHARVATLRARAEMHWQPDIDPDGIVRYGGRSTTVSPIETDVLDCMIRQFGSVVSRLELQECLPERPNGVSRNALDLHIMRLRRRIRPLGLVIRTLRGRGYVLESVESLSATAESPATPRPRRPATRRGFERTHLTGVQPQLPASEVAKLRWARDRRIAAG